MQKIEQLSKLNRGDPSKSIPKPSVLTPLRSQASPYQHLLMGRIGTAGAKAAAKTILDHTVWTQTNLWHSHKQRLKIQGLQRTPNMHLPADPEMRLPESSGIQVCFHKEPIQLNRPGSSQTENISWSNTFCVERALEWSIQPWRFLIPLARQLSAWRSLQWRDNRIHSWPFCSKQGPLETNSTAG